MFEFGFDIGRFLDDYEKRCPTPIVLEEINEEVGEEEVCQE